MLQNILVKSLDEPLSCIAVASKYSCLISSIQACSDLPESIDLIQQYEIFLKKSSSAVVAFKKTLEYAIVVIDNLLSEQLNIIIHHEKFQLLEASWRGLKSLIEYSPPHPLLKIKLLDLPWQVLTKDLYLAIEFDQSAFFKKIYSEEFDRPGGEPFGLLIGDYSISHIRKEQEISHPLETLKGVARVAAAAFVPFIAAASSELFELESYSELQPWMDLASFFKKDVYQSWQKLREEEDTRFIGLTLPRVLGRLPYELRDSLAQGLCFQEKINSSNNYLWANPAYCFAMVVIRSYCTNGWFMDIKGTTRDNLGKGVVTDLLTLSYKLDHQRVIHKPLLECKTTASQEYDINQFGLMALVEYSHTPYVAFFDCASLKKPDFYEKTVASINSKIATQLSYMLCCARFAHYIKVIIRDKIGSFVGSQEIEETLHQWLLGYTADIDNISLEAKMKYPLREAKVEVREQLAKPGSYFCIVHLRPHFQVDKIDAKFSLLMELK